MPDSYRIVFHFEWRTGNIVEDVIESCLEAGFAPTPGGSTDRCESYSANREEHSTSQSTDHLQSAVEDISENMPGTMTLWGGGADIELTFDCDSTAEPASIRALPAVDDCIVNLRIFQRGLSTVKADESAVRERIELLIEATKRIVERTDPKHVWFGYKVSSSLDKYRDIIPTDDPIVDGIDDFGWLTVLSPETVEALGGREKVLDTPAWHVEELETGHVLIVRSDHPIDPDDAPETDPADHLLGIDD